MKKALILAVVCIAAMFAGCGKETTEGNPTGISEAQGQISSEADTEDLSESPYAVNTTDGASMALVRASDTELTVSVENIDMTTLIYGEYYSVEILKDGVWYSLPYATEENVGFNSIGYELAKGESGEWTTDFEWLYGKLPAGQYRIVKDILDFRGPGDFDKYYLSAEFTVQ